MKPYWSSSDGEIYHGNVLEVLKGMADESVQMCVTSPPYWGLRDYGTATWEGGDTITTAPEAVKDIPKGFGLA